VKNDYFAVTQHIKIKGNRIHFPKLMDGIYFRGPKDKLAGIKDINQIIIPKDSGSYYRSIIYEIKGELSEKKPLSHKSQ
jgi:hypothetical protein